MMNFIAINIISHLHSVFKILINEIVYVISTMCLCVYICVFKQKLKSQQYIFDDIIGTFYFFVDILPVSTMIHKCN